VTVLDVGVLRQRIEALYTVEIAKCKKGNSGWALLHLAACIPDVCAGVQSKDAGRKGDIGANYRQWCAEYLPGHFLHPVEWWDLRCGLLHGGGVAPKAKKRPRYTRYEFGQPGAGLTHGRAVGGVLELDVHALADEVMAGVDRWIARLASNPRSDAASSVERNLGNVARVRERASRYGQVPPPYAGGTAHMLTTSSR
jgi:hypothetical protein